MGARKTRTPAMTARAKLLEKYKLKSNAKANIWLTRCPWSGSELALVGDPAVEHFYMVIGDPAVRSANFEIAQIVDASNRAAAHNFAARLELGDGKSELQSLYPHLDLPPDAPSPTCEEVARSLGATHRWVTLRELTEHRQRIWNWRRMMRFLRAAEVAPYEHIVARVRVQFETRPEIQVEELLRHNPDVEAPLIVAAVVRLLLQRALTAELDRSLFSATTQLKLQVAG